MSLVVCEVNDLNMLISSVAKETPVPRTNGVRDNEGTTLRQVLLLYANLSKICPSRLKLQHIYSFYACFDLLHLQPRYVQSTTMELYGNITCQSVQAQLRTEWLGKVALCELFSILLHLRLNQIPFYGGYRHALYCPRNGSCATAVSVALC